MANKDRQNDSLLDRAESLERETAKAKEEFRQSSGQSKFGQAFLHLKSRFPFLAWLLGLIAPLIALIGYLFSVFLKWFNWAAYVKKGGVELLNKHGYRVFSPQQFLTRSLITVISLLLIHVALSAIYFYSTRFSETVYITGKQEIETGERYQFGGCTSLPCSTSSDNGKFYLIETSLYFPRLYYPEEEVFANVPQQNAACIVEGYGIYFRNLRWLYKSAQLYQHVHNVSCRPYTDEELKRATSIGVH